MIANDRRARLIDAMADAGLDALLLYGNAWQGDYLRYATDFGMLEGQALAILRGDGSATLFLDSPLEAERARVECPGVDVVHAPVLVVEVEQALDRLRNHRIGAAPQRLLPRRIASRARELDLTDQTSFLDRLLMETRARDRGDPAGRSDRRRGLRGLHAGRSPGARRLRAGGRGRGVLSRAWVVDNFQIIGVGGVDVRGMTPPGGKRLKRGDLVTTELTPCVDGYYAQICRTLVVGEASEAQQAAHTLYRESMEAGIAAARDGVTAADIARAENDVFRQHGLGDYTTSEYTRVRGHGMGLFADSKPHLLENVSTRIDAGMTLIVHPNTWHPAVGYLVLGDAVLVTRQGCEVLTKTPRELFSVPA